MRQIKAFILCAGLGTRLKPITDHIPKPLLPVAGRPLLDFILEKVCAFTDGSIGVNTHWMADEVEAWIRGSPYAGRVTIFREDPIQGTGGALKNARGFLSDGPFLVHNVDVFSDIDLDRLVAEHESSRAMATLALHHYRQFNKILIDEHGRYAGIARKTREWRKLAFTGIAVYSPEFLEILPEGPSHVLDAWETARTSGATLNSVNFTGKSWMDLGTPLAYATAVFNELKKDGERVFIHPSEVLQSLIPEGFLAVEKGARIKPGVTLGNCVVLKGAVVKSDTRNAILGPWFSIPLPEEELEESLYPMSEIDHPLLGPEKASGSLVGVGGSDRAYYRVRRGMESVIFMVCPEGDPLYRAHMDAHDFLHAHGWPIPALRAADDKSTCAVFEDLGDLTLCDWLTCNRDPRRVEAMYRLVLDAVADLHRKISPHAGELDLLGDRAFDLDHLRWETDYFLQSFVLGIRGIAAPERGDLIEDLNRLAQTLEAVPRCILHRDLQSRNVMIASDGLPRFVDYQGMRMGPPAYDIASFLWDPYAHLEDCLRQRLLQYYVARAGLKLEEFLPTLLPCRLQRHMQALGAYGFLSRIKGKTYFLKYVPEALRLLKGETAQTREDYPELDRLVMSL